MAQWNQPRTQVKAVISSFGDGINVGQPPLSIKDSEVTYMRNMDSEDYPAISVRPGRKTKNFQLSTSITAFGGFDSRYLTYVTSNSWYWFDFNSTSAAAPGTAITTSLSAPGIGNFDELKTGTSLYVIYMDSANKKLWDTSSTQVDITDTNLPATEIFAVHKGRVYTANSKTINYCALNIPTDWTTANDAGSITITQAKGPILALKSYDDKLVILAYRSMHILYGTGPSSYTVIDVDNSIGCISHRAVTTCSGKLFWLGIDGIYQFDGVRPVRISDPVKEYIDNTGFPLFGINTAMKKCTASNIDKYIYFSIPQGGSNNEIVLKYDTEIKKWFIEDGSFVYLKQIANALHGVNYDGNIYDMRSTEIADGTTTASTNISWNFITKPFNDKSVGEKKVVSDMYLITDLSTSSTTFTMGYSTNIENNNSTSFTELLSLSGSSNTQNTRIQVPYDKLQNVNWYRLRFAGTGPCTIQSLQKNLRIKRR